MISLSSLEKLLNELPLSVVPRNTERDIADFFVKLRDSDLVGGNRKINLISYSYAQLDPDARHKWTTINTDNDDPEKRFFFYSLNERYTRIVLSVYFELHKKLFGEHAGAADSTAVLLSKLFVRDVGFRLRYDADIPDWEFGFVKPLQAFSIKLPLKRIFKEGVSEEQFRQALSTFVSEASKIENLPLESAIDDDDTVYKTVKIDDTNALFDAFSPVYACIRGVGDLKGLREEIASAIMSWHNGRSYKDFFNPVDTQRLIKNWVEICFQVFFVSLVYRSWIEYFPAPCGILYHQDKRTFRNIGGLIVGYKIREQLTAEERSAFRLISSRISAAAAIQQRTLTESRSKEAAAGA